MKKLLSILLSAVLLTAALSVTVCADTGVGIEPGQTMPDFTVSLTDGTTVTLSELLEEKDLVVLNLFASWCGPCEREFPEMDAVRLENPRMEIVAVSCEPADTMEIIADYKESHGLSFPMGLKGDVLSSLTVVSFPTTIFIDRNGNVGLVKVGAFTDREAFESKVDYFLSPDYTGTALKTEKAFDLMGWLARGLLVGSLGTLIGRWGIFRKAGKKGWYSLIPVLNTCKEYSLVWKAGFGLLAALGIPLGLLSNLIGFPYFVAYILYSAGFVLGIPEGLRLAKAFGKSKVFGVLLAFPVFKQIGRMILGLGRAKFQAPEAEATV